MGPIAPLEKDVIRYGGYPLYKSAARIPGNPGQKNKFGKGRGRGGLPRRVGLRARTFYLEVTSKNNDALAALQKLLAHRGNQAVRSRSSPISVSAGLYGHAAPTTAGETHELE